MSLLKYFSKAGVFCILLSSASAMAFESQITVNAEIDPDYGMLTAEGTPLPQSIDMIYFPGVGLKTWEHDVTFYTNVAQTNMLVSLKDDAVITDPSSLNSINLNVSVNGQTITKSGTSFDWAKVFPKGIGRGATLPMTISQDTAKSPVSNIKSAGKYSGTVTLVITKGTSASTPT
ncbi:CS1 type fimbrial major subunit [Pantoea stewartii]|uniref:CS1 type fimbrial major subunit n=1 Tax=Pantoea stewartii TaxID=66269 RepID=UPI001561C57A|nr:CS1 type fimbrial major subunit [Pantoea stewartii]NRH23406.1 hypothetical protein [Pantoea stewartii]